MGRHRQQPIGAGDLGLTRDLHGLLGRVRPGAGNHRYAPVGGLHGEGDEAALLSEAQGRCFTRRAIDDERRDALAHLPIAERAKRTLVDVVAAERHRQRRRIAAESGDRRSIRHLSGPRKGKKFI